MIKNISLPKIIVLLIIFTFFLTYFQASAYWVIDNGGNYYHLNETYVLGAKSSNAQGKDNKPEKPGGTKVIEKGKDVFKEDKQVKKVKIERVNNRLRVTPVVDGTEDVEEEIEIEEEDSVEVEIEDSEGNNSTKIRSFGNAYAVIRNRVAAKSNFPLSVNLETNELIVTTKKGSKVVTVLPDAAVNNMLAANVLDFPGGKGGLLWQEAQDELANVMESTPSGGALDGSDDLGFVQEEGTGEGVVEIPADPGVEAMVEMITTDEGELAYEIDGYKEKKLLGLFKIMLKRQVRVSAETGELIDIQQDLMTRFIDLLSV